MNQQFAEPPTTFFCTTRAFEVFEKVLVVQKYISNAKEAQILLSRWAKLQIVRSSSINVMKNRRKNSPMHISSSDSSSGSSFFSSFFGCKERDNHFTVQIELNYTFRGCFNLSYVSKTDKIFKTVANGLIVHVTPRKFKKTITRLISPIIGRNMLLLRVTKNRERKTYCLIS